MQNSVDTFHIEMLSKNCSTQKHPHCMGLVI